MAKSLSARSAIMDSNRAMILAWPVTGAVSAPQAGEPAILKVALSAHPRRRTPISPATRAAQSLLTSASISPPSVIAEPPAGPSRVNAAPTLGPLHFLAQQFEPEPFFLRRGELLLDLGEIGSGLGKTLTITGIEA